MYETEVCINTTKKFPAHRTTIVWEINTYWVRETVLFPNFAPLRLGTRV